MDQLSGPARGRLGNWERAAKRECSGERGWLEEEQDAEEEVGFQLKLKERH